jgi:lipopolysaccharide/colanic/teichoic acid biosynthesis glycosyltransferase
MANAVLDSAKNGASTGNAGGSVPGLNGAVNGLASSRDPAVRETLRPEEHSPAQAWNQPLPDEIELYTGVLHSVNNRSAIGYLIGKRLLDIVGALIGLVLFSPVFLLISLLICLDSTGQTFHRRRVLAQQSYTGGLPMMFDAFKFRTMMDRADEFLENNPELMQEYQKEFKLMQDPRVTKIGAPLRRWSLDELPQLWNVLVGQMTLVGPRMITPPELINYGPEAARLLSVKPGMTGLWQVSGRANVSYSERVRLDMFYIENRSLKLDIEILIRTVGCVLGRRGAI